MKNEIYEPFIVGETIYLRALVEEDSSGNYRKWLNDPSITQFNSHGRFPVSQEKLKEYIKQSTTSQSSLVLAVINKANNEHVGNISLQGINWIDRNAEIAFLLGEKSYWGRGIMLEAGSLLIKHGFEILNLHRIHCGTSSENSGMQKLAIKLGMQQEGIRREGIYKNGVYYDIFEYGIINTYKK